MFIEEGWSKRRNREIGNWKLGNVETGNEEISLRHLRPGFPLVYC